MNKYLVLSVFLTGCASSSPTYTPDGSQGHSLDCSGLARSWGMCYEKAGSICKERGYTIVAGGTDSIGSLAATRDGLAGASSHTRSLVIKCN
jgi:hypothetical protein